MYMHACMDGWMDGRMERPMNACMHVFLVRFNVWVSMCLCLFVSLSLCLCSYVLCTYLWSTMYRPVNHPSTYLPIHRFVWASICLSIYLPIYLFFMHLPNHIYLSIHQSIQQCLGVCLHIWMFVCMDVWLHVCLHVCAYGVLPLVWHAGCRCKCEIVMLYVRPIPRRHLATVALRCILLWTIVCKRCKMRMLSESSVAV